MCVQLSVIIPTFNEEATIRKTLDAVSRLVNVDEIVIVDGGSTDATVAIIDSVTISKPLTLVRMATANRGIQLHEGTKHAKHEIFWFLHADTRPVQGSARQIKERLRYDEIIGGSFAITFDGTTRWAKFLTWLYPHLRSVGMVFGDSAMFVRRSAYEASGGFRPYPILEDVDLFKRLRKHGIFDFVSLPATLSSRRFEHDAFFWAFVKWLGVQTLFWIGVPAATLVRVYERGKKTGIRPADDR